MDRETERRIREALGLDEVMAALDKLVEDATVGGKKDEKPEEEEYEAAVDTPCDKAYNAARNLAHDVHMMYLAFVNEGFDEDQAFILTHEMLCSFNRKALGQG